jgi:hypothetical protein
MKIYRDRGITPLIFNLGTTWKWVAKCTPWRFCLRERAPSIYWVGDWMGSRAGLDAVMKRNVPDPAGNLTPIMQLFA